MLKQVRLLVVMAVLSLNLPTFSATRQGLTKASSLAEILAKSAEAHARNVECAAQQAEQAAARSKARPVGLRQPEGPRTEPQTLYQILGKTDPTKPSAIALRVPKSNLPACLPSKPQVPAVRSTGAQELKAFLAQQPKPSVQQVSTQEGIGFLQTMIKAQTPGLGVRSSVPVRAQQQATGIANIPRSLQTRSSQAPRINVFSTAENVPPHVKLPAPKQSLALPAPKPSVIAVEPIPTTALPEAQQIVPTTQQSLVQLAETPSIKTIMNTIKNTLQTQGAQKVAILIDPTTKTIGIIGQDSVSALAPEMATQFFNAFKNVIRSPLVVQAEQHAGQLRFSPVEVSAEVMQTIRANLRNIQQEVALETKTAQELLAAPTHAPEALPSRVQVFSTAETVSSHQALPAPQTLKALPAPQQTVPTLARPTVQPAPAQIIAPRTYVRPQRTLPVAQQPRALQPGQTRYQAPKNNAVIPQTVPQPTKAARPVYVRPQKPIAQNAPALQPNQTRYQVRRNNPVIPRAVSQQAEAARAPQRAQPNLQPRVAQPANPVEPVIEPVRRPMAAEAQQDAVLAQDIATQRLTADMPPAVEQPRVRVEPTVQTQPQAADVPVAAAQIAQPSLVRRAVDTVRNTYDRTRARFAAWRTRGTVRATAPAAPAQQAPVRQAPVPAQGLAAARTVAAPGLPVAAQAVAHQSRWQRFLQRLRMAPTAVRNRFQAPAPAPVAVADPVPPAPYLPPEAFRGLAGGGGLPARPRVPAVAPVGPDVAAPAAAPAATPAAAPLAPVVATPTRAITPLAHPKTLSGSKNKEPAFFPKTKPQTAASEKQNPSQERTTPAAPTPQTYAPQSGVSASAFKDGVQNQYKQPERAQPQLLSFNNRPLNNSSMYGSAGSVSNTPGTSDIQKRSGKPGITIVSSAETTAPQQTTPDSLTRAYQASAKASSGYTKEVIDRGSYKLTPAPATDKPASVTAQKSWVQSVIDRITSFFQ